MRVRAVFLGLLSLASAQRLGAAFDSVQAGLLGAREAGMSGAGLAGPNSLEALLHNPALLPEGAGWQLGAFGGASPQRSALALGFSTALAPDLRLGFAWTAEEDLRLLSQLEQAFSLVGAVEMRPGLALGARLSALQLDSSPLKESVRGMSLDLGIKQGLLRLPGLGGEFSLAASLDRAAGSWPSQAWSDAVGQSLRLGTAYQPWQGLTLGLERAWQGVPEGAAGRGESWRFGASWEFRRGMELRGGWRQEGQGEYSLGFGSALPWPQGRAEYALLFAPAPGAFMHRFSVQFALKPQRAALLDARPVQVIRDPESGRFMKVVFAAWVDPGLLQSKLGIEIRDLDGSLKRTLKPLEGADLTFEWDGLDGQGRPLDPGLRLQYALFADLASGARKTGSPGLLDQAAALQDLAAQAREASKGAAALQAMEIKPVLASPDSASLSHVVVQLPSIGEEARSWKVDFKDSGAALLRRLEGEGGLPQELIWDGKDQEGREVKDSLGIQVTALVEAASGEKLEKTMPLFSQKAYEIAAMEVRKRPLLQLAGLGLPLELGRAPLSYPGTFLKDLIEEVLERSARIQASLYGAAPREKDGEEGPFSGDRAWFFDLFEEGSSGIIPARASRLKPLARLLDSKRGLTLYVAGASLAKEKEGRALAMRRALALVKRLEEYGVAGVQVVLQSPLLAGEVQGVRVEAR